MLTTLKPTTAPLALPRVQYTLGKLAHELRRLAEHNPGESVPHVFAPFSFLKLTCWGKRWHLRIVFGNMQRPIPFSPADNLLEEKIQTLRNYLAVPRGANRTYDESIERCFTVDFWWQEISPEETNATPQNSPLSQAAGGALDRCA